MKALVIGVDPGATTGLFVMHLDDHTVTATVARELVNTEVRYVVAIVAAHVKENSGQLLRPIVAIEQFVVSGRAGRSSTPKGGAAARQIIGALMTIKGTDQVVHPAHRVKRWATDHRLQEAGLLASTTGLGHARDASRHALFAAVQMALLPDPLSKQWIGTDPDGAITGVTV